MLSSPPPSIYQKVDSVNRRENPKFIFFSVFLFVSLVLQPASVAYAVDCQPGERGTIDIINEDFSPGTSTSDQDYRVVCSGETSGQISGQSITDAVEQGDLAPDPLRYLLIGLVGTASDTNISLNLNPDDVGEPPFGEASDDPETVVIFGDITTTTQDKTGFKIESYDGNSATPITTLKVESWANITTSGVAARGVTIYNDAGEAGSRVVFINHGEIETRGDGVVDNTFMYPARRARAIAVGTLNGDAEVVNESDGVVKTSGTGARGIQVDVDNMGTAKVTNRGSVTTTGGGFSHTGTNPVVSGADGVTATSELGDAEGTNEGTIDTTGDGARGMRIASNGAGTATATNRGRVTTRGNDYSERSADGVTASSSTGAATAINENGGTITTEGDESAKGLYAVSVGGGGSARAENSGNISTRGTEAHALIAVTSDGSTVAENRGDVTTTGENAHGVLAVALGGGTDTAPAEVSSLNESGATVTVGGDSANGVGSFIRVNGSGRNNSFGNVTAVNRGTVDVTGGTQGDDHTWGVVAGYYENEDDGTTIGNSGNAKVENSGDVTVTGRRGVGLGVDTYGTGNAEVEMTDGSVKAGTNGAEFGIDIKRTTAEFGIGIKATADTDTTNDDVGDDVDVEIDVIRSEITAYSANLDDASTTDYDESSGIGIFADAGSDANGHIVTRIERSTITADTAMKFVDGRTMLEMEYATVTGDIEFDLTGDTAVELSDIDLIGSKDVNDRMTVRHSTITGDVNFGAGNDLLEVIGSEFDGNLNMGEGDDTITVNFNGGKFSGDIDFGENTDDDDRLILDVAESTTLLFEGVISNLEYMNKRSPGTAVVGDVMFSGSTVDIEEGQLLVTGHLDVGDGDVTIHDQALLAFEVGDIVADQDDHGRITARGGIKFMEDAEQVVDIQIRHDLTETEADGVREELNSNGIDVLEAQTNFVDSGGNPITEVVVTSNGEMTENMIGSDRTVFTDSEAIAQNEEPIFEVGSTLALPPPSATARSARGGGGGSNSGLIIGAGIIAYLVWDWMDGGFGAFVDYEEENLGLSNTNVSSATSFLPGIGVEQRFQIGNSEHWIRSYAGQSPVSVAGAQTNASGTAYGINTKLRNGFDLGVSFTPRLMSSTQGLDSNIYSSSFNGELYEVQVGWQSSQFFSKLKLSHGDYDVDSVVANPVVNSALKGSFNMTNTHAQFTGGAKLEFGGVRVAPSASLFLGSLEQASHSAEGPVMRADVPEISQRYSGWKLGMNLTSSDWLKNSGNLSWRPSLHFSTMQTNTSGPSSLSVIQSDRVGALSFANQAGVRGMPSAVHALGVSTIIKQSKNSRFNVGYFGSEVDGERDHAVLARYQLRF